MDRYPGSTSRLTAAFIFKVNCLTTGEGEKMVLGDMDDSLGMTNMESCKGKA